MNAAATAVEMTATEYMATLPSGEKPLNPVLRRFLVIGYYADGKRWADSYDRISPEDAESSVALDNPDVMIAGVVEIVNGVATLPSKARREYDARMYR